MYVHIYIVHVIRPCYMACSKRMSCLCEIMPQAWNPFNQADINQLLSVQRKFCKRLRSFVTCHTVNVLKDFQRKFLSLSFAKLT